MKALYRVCTTLTVLMYAFLAIFGLLAMNYIHTHDMASMERCPFMVGQQSLCTMTVTDHVTAFNNIVHSTIIQIALLAAPVLFVFFLLLLHPPNLFKEPVSPFRQDFFSLLFSQGILHPKAP